MTDLEHFIKTAPLIDTHEHLWDEQTYVEKGPDIIQDLFDNYVTADLVVAGASPETLEQALDATNPDIASRFALIESAWEQCQFTGYGEAVRLIAKHVYGLDAITVEGLETAKNVGLDRQKPGERLRILRDLARLEHIQIDNMQLACKPDVSGPDFFLYDLSWVHFANAAIDTSFIFKETKVELKTLDDLRQAASALFAKYAPLAVAVKTQHAYERTLLWQARSDSDAEKALQKQLSGTDLSLEERLCLGDWCLARGVELAIRHNLPIKIHTGYYAGHSRMPVDFIKPGNLCELLKTYPQARFVLMHTGYPYGDEMIALAKHYPNVYVDMCWAWSIDPYSSKAFIRKFIHTVPSNKLFAFGGDTFWPSAALAYSLQARTWLSKTLQAEIDDGFLKEVQAITIAEKMMSKNQQACFDIEGTRAAIKAVGREENNAINH